MRLSALRGISRRFHRLSPCRGQVAYALRTRAPVAGSPLLGPAAPRLACVKPAASVHPEPGSNSSLYIHFITLSPIPTGFLKKRNQRSRIQKLFSVLACTSFSLFNDLLKKSRSFPNGTAKVQTFSAKSFQQVKLLISRSYIPAATISDRPATKKRNIRASKP